MTTGEAVGPVPKIPLSRARAKVVARLHRRRTREREGAVLVEGPRAVAAALDAGVTFRFAVVEAGGPSPHPHLEARLHRAGVELAEADPASFRELAGTDTPQGLLAVVEEPRWGLDHLAREAGAGGDPGGGRGDPGGGLHPGGGRDSAGSDASGGGRDSAGSDASGGGRTPDPRGAPTRPTPHLVLVLDALQDPGNVGTLIRAAAAFGARGIVALDGTADPWSPKVVRATAGESFRVPVVSASWSDFHSWLEERGGSLLVADAGGEDVRAFAGGPAHPPPGPTLHALLIGNEGAGPRLQARQAAHATLALPLVAGVESLNAAVAGSVLLWALGPGRLAPVPAGSNPGPVGPPPDPVGPPPNADGPPPNTDGSGPDPVGPSPDRAR